MITDKFSLDKYILKKRFGGKFVVLSEAGELLFQAVKPFAQKAVLIHDSNVVDSPLLTVRWGIKRGLFTLRHNYTITDRTRSAIATIECEKSPVFSSTFSIKDMYKKEIGVIQPDQINYVCEHINIVVEKKKAAIFYKNARRAVSYVMAVNTAGDIAFDRKLALYIAVLLSFHCMPMKKFSGTIDWNQTVTTGDDMYKIKRRGVVQ